MSILLQLVQRELKKGHIEPSVSPWNTPVFVIPKRSGEGFRLLHDLRAVNKKIQPMGPVQTRLPGNSFIPTNQPCAVIDIKDCFFSIPLHEQDKERFAFSIVFPNGQPPNLWFQWKVLPQGMVNSPTICQIVVSQALTPIGSANPQANVIQYMDDILIAAPLPSQVDSLVTAVSEVLKTNGFEIAEAKIKRGPSVTFLGMKISSSYVSPPAIQIRHNIKTLHDAQQVVGSLQWLRNVVLVPPEVMSLLYDLLKGKHPWEQKTISEEATRLLDYIEKPLSTAVLSRWNPHLPLDLYVHFTKEGGIGVLAQGSPESAKPVQFHVRCEALPSNVQPRCLYLTSCSNEEALYSRQGTVSVVHVNSHSPIKGFYQIGNDKADAAAKGIWTLQEACQLHEALHVGAKALVKRCNIPIMDAKHIVATCPYCQKSPLWSSGVNPRGLKALEIWQTDFTLCQLLKPRAWFAVTVDTYSNMIIATQHAKANSKANIQHWLRVMAWLGIPKQIKTDNGTNFASKPVQEFANK
ncbi:endogenous retrovirus group K member 18 Pol protein-like protein [Turdus rufiventris]|nr:endogenous retrovirus group K member 18 Pol protein-like protein [Turdus rufiventris]